MKRLVPIAAALSCTAAANAHDLAWGGSLETWIYGTAQVTQDAGPLNPGNRVALLPQSELLADTRAQVQGRLDAFDVTLRVRSVFDAQHVNGNAADQNDTYPTQAFVRARPGAGWTLSAGRMLLTWGPAYLRSPSSPFYYDAGRTQPLRELSGIDAASVLYSSNAWSVQGIDVFGSGHTSGSQAESFQGSQMGSARFARTQLVKFDWRAPSWLASAIAADRDNASSYLGGFAQWTVDDAWLLYAEAGNGRRPDALVPDRGGAPFTLQQPSPRATTALLGAGYTLENGQSANLEYLYDGHGYTGSGETAYFDAAAQVPPTDSRLAISAAPVLLARHYLALVWQSNPQENTQYWRLFATRNLSDHSMQWNVYGERNINPHLTLFATATVDTGGASREFEALVKRSITLGAKLFIL